MASDTDRVSIRELLDMAHATVPLHQPCTAQMQHLHAHLAHQERENPLLLPV